MASWHRSFQSPCLPLFGRFHHGDARRGRFHRPANDVGVAMWTKLITFRDLRCPGVGFDAGSRSFFNRRKETVARRPRISYNIGGHGISLTFVIINSAMRRSASVELACTIQRRPGKEYMIAFLVLETDDRHLHGARSTCLLFFEGGLPDPEVLSWGGGGQSGHARLQVLSHPSSARC